MKLASLASGRDGTLVVVSRDLSTMLRVPDIAPTLQAALDQWQRLAPLLQQKYHQLNASAVTGGENFSESACASPLPRAYQWADGSAYVNHVELVRRARGAQIPESFWHDPLMYQGGSDTFLAPRENIRMPQTLGWGVDFEAEVAVITDDVPLAVSVENAAEHIKLIMLVNDVSLRGLIPDELAKGFGFFQSKPSSAFSPVCITPDELGDAWRDSKVHLPLISILNGERFGHPDAGVDMTFNFAQLIAHAARTRALCAGSIIGSGTVSNKYHDEPGKTLAEGGVGYSCIAELRMIETLRTGAPTTPFMEYGDSIRIEMLDQQGRTLFGAIEQTLHPT